MSASEPMLSVEAAADLALASACAQHDPSALAELDLLLRDEVRRAVRPIDPSLVDEVTQLVRERLLVPDGDGALRISEFKAQGPLRGWLRAVALRTALNALKAGGREQPVSPLPDLPLAAPDPELALLQARYRDSFRAAFAVAVSALTPRERTVLRLHTLDGLTLARIGAMYGKDTSRVSRWLAQIRATLLQSTHAALAAQLALPQAELDSVLRAAGWNISVSLARLLAN